MKDLAQRKSRPVRLAASPTISHCYKILTKQTSLRYSLIWIKQALSIFLGKENISEHQSKLRISIATGLHHKQGDMQQSQLVSHPMILTSHNSL